MDFSFEDDPTSGIPEDSEYYNGEYYEDQDYESSDNSYDHTADSFSAPPPPQTPFPVEDVCPAPPPPGSVPPGSPFSLNLKVLSAVNNPASPSFKKPMQLPPTPHDKVPSREELSRPDSLPLPASPLPPPPPARDRRVAPPRANIVGVSSTAPPSNGSPLVPERQTPPPQTSSDSALSIPRRPAAPPRQSSSLSASSLVAANPPITPSVPPIPSSVPSIPSTIPPAPAASSTPLPNASSPQKPPPIPSSAPPLPSAPPPLPTSAPPLPSGTPPKPSVLGTPPRPTPPAGRGRGGAPPPAPSRQNTFSGSPSVASVPVVEQKSVPFSASQSLSDVTLSINHIKDWPHVVRSCLLELEHLDFDRCHQAHASHPLFQSQCLIENSFLINGSRRSLLPGYDVPPLYDQDTSLYSFQKYAAGNLQSQAPSTHSSSSAGSGRKRTVTGDPSMQHSKKISNSLHKLSTKQQQTIALEIFDNILCFMGDKVPQKPNSPGSLALSAPLTADNVSKPSTEHLILAQNILDIGVQSLSSDTIICNEIYAQLIKQLSNNSRMESEERGWMLMCFATSTFTPDSELMPYLVHYLKKSTTDPTIASFAWFALQALQKTLCLQKKGSFRSFAPSIFELQSLVNLAPMMCRVSCMDGTQKAFYIDGEATILQLLHSFCDKMEIPYSTRLNFGLFISIASSFSSSSGSSSSSSSSLHASSASKDFEKALAFNTLVVDAFRVLEKQLLQRSATIESVKSSENMKFWFQRITYTNRKKPYNSAIEKQMMFFQIRRDILHDRLPLDPVTAVKLLTLIHQYDNGDYNENDVISEPQVHKYIPPSLLQTLVASFPSSSALISKISEEHLALLHTSREQVIDRFVRLAQQLTFYGCYLYPVELDNAPDCASDLGIHIKNPQPDSPPFVLQLVVSEVGIQFFSSDLSELYQLFPFSRLARWGSSSLHCQIEYFANDGVTKKLALLKSSEASHVAKIITAFTMRIAELSCFAKVIEDFGPEQFQSLQEEGLTYSDMLSIKQGDHLLILERDKGNGWEFGVKLTDRLDSQVDFFSNFGNFPASCLTHIIELPPNYRRALSAVVSSSM